MEDNSEVVDQTIVMEKIFNTCDTENKNAVLASTLLEFLDSFIKNESHPSEWAKIRSALDPLNENPLISRETFYTVMKSWVETVSDYDGELHSITFRESDSNENDLNGLPFHQSTPKERMNILQNFSNESPKSFISDIKGTNSPFYEEHVYDDIRQWEHKYMKAQNEIESLKSQLLSSEEQYTELKADLDRTSKRLRFQQQVNAELQKSMEQSDGTKEESLHLLKEINSLQKLWSASRAENSIMASSLKQLECEKDHIQLKMKDMQKKSEQYRQEVEDLKIALSISEKENETLKRNNDDFLVKIEEQNSSMHHRSEMLEMMKTEQTALLTMLKKHGVAFPKSSPNLTNILGTSPVSPKCLRDILHHGTPFKNMYNPSGFCRHIFNSPKLIRQLTSPVSVEGMDTPKRPKCEVLPGSEKLNVSDLDHEVQKVVMRSPKCEKAGEATENDSSKFVTGNLSTVSSVSSVDTKPISPISDTPPLTTSNAVSEQWDDLDLSTSSGREMLKAQDLRSELQDCKFWENSNRCCKEDYSELLKVKEEHENCSQIINDCKDQIDLLKLKVNELEAFKTENEILQNQIESMKTEHEINCMEVDTLTKRLEYCKDLGETFVKMMKKKLIDQNKKVENLNSYNQKLEKYVEELKADMETTTTDLQMWRSADAAQAQQKILTLQKSEEDESTSTEGSDTTLYQRKLDFRKGSNYVRKSNYERQQVKINRLEEKNEELLHDLYKEQVKSQKVGVLECEIATLQLINKSLEEERNRISRELDTIRHDLHVKQLMLSQFQEKYQFEVENLNAACRKEIETIKLDLTNAENAAKDTENSLKSEIDKLKKILGETTKEKTKLEKLIEKQANNIISLRKALSDLSTSSEEGKAFENIVKEKESMLMFNRELLAKSNNSLLEAEQKIVDLEVLLDKCRMVLFDTSAEVFRSAKSAFVVWKDTLKNGGADNRLIDDLESLEDITNKTVCDFDEQDVFTIHNRLSLSANLFKELAKKTEMGLLNNELTIVKEVSKFTLKPSKLNYQPPGSGPNISSFGMKEIKSQQELQEMDAEQAQYEVFLSDTDNGQQAEIDGSKIQLKVNDSVTDWLGHQSENLSCQTLHCGSTVIQTSEIYTQTQISCKTIGVGDDSIDVHVISKSQTREDQNHYFLRRCVKRCNSFMMLLFSSVCLVVMVVFFVHLECIRSNETVICPLDFLISIKRDFNLVPPY